MGGPFGSAGVFAPNVGEKNARTALIEYATHHGWLLDLTATRSRHVWRDEPKEQDPNQFLRAAAHGGHWVVNLDYEVKGDPEAYRTSRQWDNTLRAVTLWHSSWVDERGRRTGPGSYQLKNYHQANSSRSRLWDLTDSADGKFKPLRKRAEEILRDPDLAVWLLMEQIENERQAEKNRRREWEERAALRRRPLTVAVSQDHFREMARQLRRTAATLADADGLTDLQAEVARAEALVADLRTAVGKPGETASERSV